MTLYRTILATSLLCLESSGCHPSSTRASPPVASPNALETGSRPTTASSDTTQDAAVAPAVDASTVIAAPQQIDPDGNDDPTDTGTGTLPQVAHFTRVGRPPKALKRICDLRPFQNALYSSHARSPLGNDGATIGRYNPDESPAFKIAFDWNRPGEPSRGGGSGQGFTRIRALKSRLFVPDTDPPYAGFHITDSGTEGFVYVSDANGVFAPPRMPHFRPPAVPTPEGTPGAAVLPRAYHVLDTIHYRGHYYASTGSVPPRERAWEGPSPGALHVANETWRRWNYVVGYPYPFENGVWRLTYMVRFRDRLYAGIQDYDFREPNDYVVFTLSPEDTLVSQASLHAMRVSDEGTAQTLRWYADNGHLYWITLEKHARGVLRVSDDGDTWRVIPLPAGTGRPTDITRFRNALVVLTERGLYRLDGETPVRIAAVLDERSPFEITDWFCAAPLAVYRNALYAGGQFDGSLYRLDDGEESFTP